jgi:hypothetical protein
MQNGLFYNIVKNEPQGRFWDRVLICYQHKNNFYKIDCNLFLLYISALRIL